MSESTAATQDRTRRIVHRTFGERQGAMTRLMSPSHLGRRLKPFVFLDLFDTEGASFSGFGWHPHSGIAKLTYLWEGSVRYEDTTGAAGFLPAGGVEVQGRSRCMARRRCWRVRPVTRIPALDRPAART